MKKKYILLRSCLILIFALSVSNIKAQVGINTTTPAGGAILDVESTDKGILIPRVDITDLNTIAPITGGSTQSLLVYNTNATTGVGFYYWNGSRWVGIDGERDWKLSGNSGTNPATNFLGTTDNVDLRFRTNNTERMYIVNDGRVSVNGAPLFINDRFSVFGASGDYVINGYATGAGIGVYGDSPDEKGIQGVSLNSDGGLGASFTSTRTGFAGSNDVGDGFYTTNADGSGIAAEGFHLGVFGIANDASDSAYGGYFENDGSYAYIGGWEFWGGWTSYKILGTGTVSTIVKGLNNEPLTMACPEAPEILFQDFGTGQLVNGYAKINIDPVFSKNIVVNQEHPLKVFIQLEGNCNGVYVTNKSATSFEVFELQNGTSNVPFSWFITATRADEEFTTKDGNKKVSNNGWRFAPAPLPLIKKQNATNIKRKN